MSTRTAITRPLKTAISGRENDDDYINDPTKAGESALPSAKKAWFGQPSSEHVRGAVERIRRAEGTGSVAGGTSANLPGNEAPPLDELSRLKGARYLIRRYTNRSRDHAAQLTTGETDEKFR